MNALNIRLATGADARGIAGVRVSGWQSAYRGLIQDEYLDRMDVSKYTQKTLDLFAEPVLSTNWVCMDGVKTIGWMSIKLIDDSVTRRQNRAELLALYVLDSFWHRGVGFLMWQTAMSFLAAHGVRAVSLWVLEGNHRAIKFYARQGFNFDGTTKTERLAPTIELKELRMRLFLGDTR